MIIDKNWDFLKKEYAGVILDNIYIVITRVKEDKQKADTKQ